MNQWRLEGLCVVTLPADLDRDDPVSVAEWASYRVEADRFLDQPGKIMELCRECPVRSDCLSWGRKSKKAFSEMSPPGIQPLTLLGVWGGVPASAL